MIVNTFIRHDGQTKKNDRIKKIKKNEKKYEQTKMKREHQSYIYIYQVKI